MAVDTAAKRASALGFALFGIVLPVPDGTITQGDRQHLAGYYSGISTAVVSGKCLFIAVATRAHLAIAGQRRNGLDLAGDTRAYMGITGETRPHSAIAGSTRKHVGVKGDTR